ncbi:MAG: methyl-accepting chemotaxis protein [Magnetococcales bacterium]|nr:methyl-accepting chemotaxis protein [Magnetococcales bacterium]
MSAAIDSSDPAARRSVLPPGRYVRLRIFLPIIFCLLIGVVSLLIIFITHRSATRSIESLATDVMTRVSQRVVDKTSFYLDSAAYMVQMNANAWQRGQQEAAAVGQNFLELFDRTSREQLSLFPYFGLVYYGDQQGNHWLNKREQDGTIHMRVITRKEDSPASKQALEWAARQPKGTPEERDALARGLAPYLETYWYEQNQSGALVRSEQDPIKIYDPRLRPWYVGAMEQQKKFWTDVYGWEEKYKGVVSRQVGITVSAPVLRAGQLIGVCGIDISLQAVSLFLRDMEIIKHGRAFILNAQGETVSLPDYREVLASAEGSDDRVHLNHVSRVSDTAVAASYAALRAALGVEPAAAVELEKERVVSFPVAGQHYYGFFKPFATGLGLNWTVGVVVPEDDFLGSVKEEMRQSLLVALVSIVLMSVVAVLIGRLVTHPLAHLGREVERIMQLDLAPTPCLTTRLLEFRMISLAFTRMKLTLAEVVNTLSVHTRTLDWSAEEFANVALTLEEEGKGLQQALQGMRSSIDQLPEQEPETKALRQVAVQMEGSVRLLNQLSQPVVERVEAMNQSAQALRETLQSVRI